MRDQDRDAEFGDFVAEHRSALMGAARLLAAGDEALAEDLVQSTLTRLYVKWRQVRRADNRFAYARTSLTHAFIDETRRAYRSRETAAEAYAADQVPGPAATVEVRTLVADALAQLGPRQRAAVVLRHWLDLDVAETAQILKCSEGTVKSQTARALAQLRRVLEPIFDPATGEIR